MGHRPPVVAPPRQGWKRWLVYTPSATLSLLLILTAANESYSMAADHWKGQLLSVTLTFLVPQALLALLLGLGQLAKRRAPRISHAINIAAVITSLISLAAMTYGMTGGYRHLVVKHYTYTDRRIPQPSTATASSSCRTSMSAPCTDSHKWSATSSTASTRNAPTSSSSPATS